MWWALAVGAIVGYLIGSVQFGLIVGRATKGFLCTTHQASGGNTVMS